MLKTLVGIGAPVDRYLQQVALSRSVLEHPERFIPLRQASRLLQTAAAGEGIPGLALRAGTQARIEDLGTFGSVILSAGTLGKALLRLIDAATAFNCGERWWLEDGGNLMRLCHRFVEDRIDGYHELDQFGVAVVVNLIRRAAGASWLPREVQWRAEPSSTATDSPLFHGTRHVFSQPVTAVVIPSIVFHRSMPIMPPQPAVDVEAWRRDLPPTDFESVLREVVDVVSPRDGHPRIKSAATALGMSVRTLQRRLSDHRLTFDQLVKTTRLRMAAHLLERTETKIIGIALDLGYSDHAHFTRAFHKWTGYSPMEYRRRHRVESVDRSDVSPFEGRTP